VEELQTEQGDGNKPDYGEVVGKRMRMKNVPRYCEGIRPQTSFSLNVRSLVGA